MEWPAPLPLDNGHAQGTVVCAVIFPVLATLFVAGRFAARHIKRAAIGWDDRIIVLALLAIYGQMIIIILSVVYGGVGHHIEELSENNIFAFYKLIALVQFTFGSSLGLAKISICLLLIRIFFTRSFRIAAYCVMTYCACWMIMVIAMGAGLCRPFAFNWDKTIPGGTCGALDPAYISIAALDIVGDAAIILLPMHSIWSLKTSTSAKVALSAVFALGFLDIIVAILRIVYLVRTKFSPGSDFTWASTGTYEWSVIEPSLAVIVACSAVLRPLFSSWIPKLGSSRHSSVGSYFSKFKRSKEAYSDLSYTNVPLGKHGVSDRETLVDGGHYDERSSVRNDAIAVPIPALQRNSNPKTIRVKQDISVHSDPKDGPPVVESF